MTTHCSQTIPRTFVVPLDGSDFAARAVPVAAELAGRFDAELVLMTVPTTLDPDAQGVRLQWLEDAARATGSARVETAIVEAADPAAGVLELLDARGHAGLVMATHGRGVLGTTALGSVAQEVVRCAGPPSLLVGRECDAHRSWRGPVLVCHDGSVAADAALAPARAWADALGVHVELVHVFHPLDVATAEAPTAAIGGALVALGPGVRAHVERVYRPADAIHDVAEELGASLVVMSTHGRTGLARVVLGSVAMGVVRASLCPVLVTRPSVLAGQSGVDAMRNQGSEVVASDDGVAR